MTGYTDKVVLITGAKGGFGLEFVRRFAELGARVVAVDIAASAGNGLESYSADRLLYIQGDVTAIDTWNLVKSKAHDAFGGVDIIINNAGTFPKKSPTHSADIAVAYDKTFNLNVRSIFLSVQAFAEGWVNDSIGGKRFSPAVVINLGSSGGIRVQPEYAFYCTSKAAVSAATEALALEYAPHVRFVCIAPSLALTNMGLQVVQASTTEEGKIAAQSFVARSPMKRLCEPSDVAILAVFLASDHAAYLTGSTYPVDGGMTPLR